MYIPGMMSISFSSPPLDGLGDSDRRADGRDNSPVIGGVTDAAGS